MLQTEHRGFFRLPHGTHCEEARGRLNFVSCALVLTKIFRPDHTSNSLGELSVSIIPQYEQNKKTRHDTHR